MWYVTSGRLPQRANAHVACLQRVAARAERACRARPTAAAAAATGSLRPRRNRPENGAGHCRSSRQSPAAAQHVAARTSAEQATAQLPCSAATLQRSATTAAWPESREARYRPNAYARSPPLERDGGRPEPAAPGASRGCPRGPRAPPHRSHIAQRRPRRRRRPTAGRVAAAAAAGSEAGALARRWVEARFLRRSGTSQGVATGRQRGMLQPGGNVARHAATRDGAMAGSLQLDRPQCDHRSAAQRSAAHTGEARSRRMGIAIPCHPAPASVAALSAVGRCTHERASAVHSTQSTPCEYSEYPV